MSSFQESNDEEYNTINFQEQDQWSEEKHFPNMYILKLSILLINHCQ